MRINYQGNHLFALPKKGGGVQSWTKGQTHSFDQEQWDKYKDRKDIKFMVNNGTLVLMGVSSPSVTDEKSLEKTPEPSVTLEESYKKEEPQVGQNQEKSTKDVLSEVRKMPYKTAIKWVEDSQDFDLLRKLQKEEKRPSVLKVLEAILS